MTVETDGEGAEAVSELFNRYGTGGAVVYRNPDSEDLAVKTYLPVDEERGEARRRLEEGLWHLSQLHPLSKPTLRFLAYEDWATAWRENVPVLHIGRRLVIRPPWLEYFPQSDEVVIGLKPAMAFGTGLHPTTRMCLLAVEELIQPEMRVLDLGTGSGILAITAAKLGARSVLALDIDQTAVIAARANVVANEVADRVQVERGSLEGLKSGWHLMLVNILAQTIISLLDEGLADRLAPEGKLVAAGIIEEQAEEVERAFISQGLTISDRKRDGDWITLIGQKPIQVGNG